MGAYGFSTRQLTAGFLAVLLVSLGIVTVAVDTSELSMPGASDSEERPGDIGPLDTVSMSDFAVALDVDDTADNVYLIEAGTELPDEFGDYTADVQSDILDEIDSDAYVEAEVGETEDGKDIFGFEEAEIRGDDPTVVPGQQYHVLADGVDIHHYFGEYTVPEEVMWGQYSDRIPETINTDYWEEASSLTVENEEVRTEDGDRASDDLQMNTGLASAVTEIYDDDAFEAVVELDVNDGTALFGAISGASIADEHDMSEVTVEVHVNGDNVYQKTVSATDASELNEDFAEAVEENPETADNDVKIVVQGEMDNRAEPADGSEEVLVEFTLEDIYEDLTHTVTIEG